MHVSALELASKKLNVGSDGDLLDFIIDLNLHRRHLDESQRAMAAGELANLGEGRPSKTPQICGVSTHQAATLLNVSERSVETAKAVKRQAEPEIVKLVEDGKLAREVPVSAPFPSVDHRRLAEACRIAGVEPKVDYLNGEDPLKRIWSENAPRRHMGKGALAMVAACMYPDPEKGGRGQKSPVTDCFPGVDKRRVAEAREVRALAPDLADGVMDGSVSFDAAYKAATDRKKAREWFHVSGAKTASVGT